MGTIQGHVIPALPFLMVSFFWLWAWMHQYFKSRMPAADVRSGGTAGYKFRSSLTFVLNSSSTRGPEAYPFLNFITCAFAAWGLLGEMHTGIVYGDVDVPQHVAMYAAYIFANLCPILWYYRVPLPRKTDGALFILALMIEAMLFSHHLRGRSPIDVQIHTNLVYTLVATAIAVAFEMRDPSNELAALSRTLLIMVQGFWFILTGYMLYAPQEWRFLPWNEDSTPHTKIVWVTVIYCACVYGCIVVAMVFGFFVGRRVKKLGHTCPTYEQNLDFLGNDRLNALLSEKETQKGRYALVPRSDLSNTCDEDKLLFVQ